MTKCLVEQMRVNLLKFLSKRWRSQHCVNDGEMKEIGNALGVGRYRIQIPVLNIWDKLSGSILFSASDKL